VQALGDSFDAPKFLDNHFGGDDSFCAGDLVLVITMTDLRKLLRTELEFTFNASLKERLTIL